MEPTKQRIEKLADDYAFQVPYDGTENFYNKEKHEGYIAGATAELERSKKLLQEYREVIRELLPLADGMVFEMRGTVNDDVTQKCENKVERAKSLIEPKTDKA